MNQFEKVGMTGTRQGMTLIQREMFRTHLILFQAKEVHEGDCVGADIEAAVIAKGLNLRVVSHPPVNPKYRGYGPFDEERALASYLIRNENIVNSTQILIATPKGMHEELRSGTWACIRYAFKKARPLCIIFPNGETRIENY